MEITIEKASPADAEAILTYTKCIGGESQNLTFGPEGLPFTAEQERALLAGWEHSGRNVMLLARQGGQILGMGSFSSVQSPRMAHRGEIGLSVRKDYWGRHIGSRLLEELLRFAHDTAHAEIISLEVRSDNARAIRLYRKYGFEKIGQFRGFFKIDGAWIDFDLMNLYDINLKKEKKAEETNQ